MQRIDLHGDGVTGFDIQARDIDGAMEHTDGSDDPTGLAANFDCCAGRLDDGLQVGKNSAQTVALATAIFFAADVEAVIPADRNDGKIAAFLSLPNGTVAGSLTFLDTVNLVNGRLNVPDRAQSRLKSKPSQNC